MTHYFPRVRLSLKAIMLVAEGLAKSRKGMSLSRLAQYTTKTEQYAEMAAAMATELGFATRGKDGFDFCPSKSWLLDAQHYRRDQAAPLFSNYLVRWRPFELFLGFIQEGDSPEVAVRRMCSLLGQDAPSGLETTLCTWGKQTGLLAKDNQSGKWHICAEVEETPVSALTELRRAATSEASARLFLRQRLGREAFDYLDDGEMEDLSRSILDPEPRDRIDALGRALEDVLRRLGNERGVDLSKASGIEQVANRLKQKNLITEKHHKCLLGINAGRIASAHSKGKKTMQRWQVRQESAESIVLRGLDALHSVYHYMKAGKRIL